MAPSLPDNLKRPLRWVGYVVFAILAAALSFYFTLPRERIQERVESAASDWLGAEVSAQEFGLSLLPGFNASGVTIRSRPAAQGEKPTVYTIDDLSVRVGVLEAIRG